MALFKKDKRTIVVGGQTIELEPKPSKGPFGFLNNKKKAPPKAGPTMPLDQGKAAAPGQAGQNVQSQQPPTPQQPPAPKPEQQEDLNKIELDFGKQKQAAAEKKKEGLFARQQKQEQQKQEQLSKQQQATPKLEFPDVNVEVMSSKPGTISGKAPGKANPFSKYISKTAAKQKGLQAALRQQGIDTDVYSFVKRMTIAAIVLAAVIGITTFIILNAIGLQPIEGVLIGAVMGIAVFQAGQRVFLQFPSAKERSTSKNVERDILFAARDLIISLRSGMPLFNAIASVSKGYGDASKEFAKIVDRVQLGMPLEEAIDDTIATTKSGSFRRIMLQASVSIKAGADVVTALQSIIDQLSQERTIELRAYGQKLNAIAMFYMLFGVILPSMGIAVITILTTFIALFSVNVTIFEFVIVGILALQIIFLKLITGSRPAFTM